MTNKLNKPTKVVKAKYLTLAQVMTLHRIRAGGIFRLRADLKLGTELRLENKYKARHVSARSIPALYRLGLVDFISGWPASPEDQGKFFQVSLTSRGWDILGEFDEAVGRK